MTKSKQNCIEVLSISQRATKTMRFVSLFLAILSLSAIDCATLPVKNFPAVFSHKSPLTMLSNVNGIRNGNENPGAHGSLMSSNGQKETAEMGLNSEGFPKHSMEMPVFYPIEETGYDSDPAMETELLDNEDESVQLQELAKRAPNKWQGLQGGWGKRAPNNWNKLSAAWGKRRIPNNAAWNNLSGMWGKKRAKWNELSGMWGKRAAWRDMSGGWGKKKRAMAPHWNKLRGMWGKRSAMSPLPVDDAENQRLGNEPTQQMVQQIEPQQQFQSLYAIDQPNTQQESSVSALNKKDHGK